MSDAVLGNFIYTIETQEARIQLQQELIELAYGLLWHDKHNEARRLLLGALSKEEQAKGLSRARFHHDKYRPGETPLPGPIGKAIEALEDAAKQSQLWAFDDDDTSWMTYRAASVMLMHWAAGLAGGKDESNSAEG